MSSPVAVPDRVSQSTVVEQSRAVAEVQAAMLVAQQRPRDEQRARRRMEDACRQKVLAERAFFRFRRGTGNVNGETIHLARELALYWGNVQYGVYELARHDERHESEMLAYAWDLQENSRASAGFIVPHKRDAGGGVTLLESMRDIYENNANAGARRLRQCIFAVLPLWYREKAIDLCRETLAEKGPGGRPRAERVAEVIEWYRRIGVREADLVRKLDGTPTDRWDDQDIVNLGVILRSIQRGETTRDEEFPRQLVTPDELTAGTSGGQPATPAATPPAADPPQPPAAVEAVAPPAEPAPPTEPAALPGQLKALHTLLGKYQVEDPYKLRLFTAYTGREITSSRQLTRREAGTLLDQLERITANASAVEDGVLAIDEYLTSLEQR